MEISLAVRFFFPVVLCTSPLKILLVWMTSDILLICHRNINSQITMLMMLICIMNNPLTTPL